MHNTLQHGSQSHCHQITPGDGISRHTPSPSACALYGNRPYCAWRGQSPLQAPKSQPLRRSAVSGQRRLPARLSSSHSTNSRPLFFFFFFFSHSRLSSHLRPRPSRAAVRTSSTHPDQCDSSHSLGRSGRLFLLAAQVNGRRRSLGKDGYCAWEHSPQYPDFPGPNGSQNREYHTY